MLVRRRSIRLQGGERQRDGGDRSPLDTDPSRNEKHASRLALTLARFALSLSLSLARPLCKRHQCTTSCREYPEEKSAASAKALAPRKAPAEQSPPPREEQSAKERQERKKKVFPKKLAICAGGYLLRLMSIHRARTLGSQETKQPDEQNISLVEFKPMDGKRPVEESAEETSADHDDHEEEEEEEVSLSGEAEATEVGKDDRIEGFESSPEFSPVRSSTVLKEIETILETERKSKEDVLAFTMEQSVLRAREKTEMRAALDQKDREIQRKDEILHMVLGSISQSLGIASFPDDEAGGGSPESAWRVKEEAILRKIKDLSTERSNKGPETLLDLSLRPSTRSSSLLGTHEDADALCSMLFLPFRFIFCETSAGRDLLRFRLPVASRHRGDEAALRGRDRAGQGGVRAPHREAGGGAGAKSRAAHGFSRRPRRHDSIGRLQWAGERPQLCVHQEEALHARLAAVRRHPVLVTSPCVSKSLNLSLNACNLPTIFSSSPSACGRVARRAIRFCGSWLRSFIRVRRVLCGWGAARGGTRRGRGPPWA